MVRLIGRSVCSKKVVKDFWDLHSSSVTVEGRIVDSYMDGISGNLFAVLVYYLEVGYVGWGVVIVNAVFVNCNGDMTNLFFYSIFQTSVVFFYVRKVAIFFLVGPFEDYVYVLFLVVVKSYLLSA